MLYLYCAMLETDTERNIMTKIYEQHKHFLLAYALKIVQDRATAEDAVHNTFIAIIEHKEKYFSLDCMDFRRSAVIIVRNKCFDLLRKQKPFVDKPIEDLEIYLEPEGISVEQKVENMYEYELIRKHLNSIDEISRQVLLLKYIEGLSYNEIGEKLGMTPKHVDTRIMRAKEKVRKLVEKEAEK